MSRNARGWGADYSNAREGYMRQDDNGASLTGQNRWERDVETRYVVHKLSQGPFFTGAPGYHAGDCVRVRR